MPYFAENLKNNNNTAKMNQQSLNKPITRVIFATVAAASVLTVAIFSPSRRRPYMARA